MKLTRYFFSLAVLALVTVISAPEIAQSSIPAGSVRIHYHRNNPDYTGWTIFDWTGALHPSPSYQAPVLRHLCLTISACIGTSHWPPEQLNCFSSSEMLMAASKIARVT